MRCVSSESPPSSNILVLVRAMVLPFRSSGIDDENSECASSINAQEAKRQPALAGIRRSPRFGFATDSQIPFRYSIRSFLSVSLSCKLNWVSCVRCEAFGS